jgi:hypothetical protein
MSQAARSILRMFMVDVTLSHDFIGTGQTGLNQG